MNGPGSHMTRANTYDRHSDRWWIVDKTISRKWYSWGSSSQIRPNLLNKTNRGPAYFAYFYGESWENFTSQCFRTSNSAHRADEFLWLNWLHSLCVCQFLKQCQISGILSWSAQDLSVACARVTNGKSCCLTFMEQSPGIPPSDLGGPRTLCCLYICPT